jgi:hypothetical protein
VTTAISGQQADFNSGLANGIGNGSLVSTVALDSASNHQEGQWSNATTNVPTPANLWSSNSFSLASISTSTAKFIEAGYVGGAALGNAGVNLGTFAFSAPNGTLTFTANSTTTSAVPLPGAVWMFAAGLMSMLGFSRRKAA